MKQSLAAATTVVLLAAMALSDAPTQAATKPQELSASIPPILRALVPRLEKTQIPLYLPTWLPPYEHELYTAIAVSANHYSVTLRIDQSSELAGIRLAFGGSRGKLERVASDTRPTLMQVGSGFAHGLWGYIDPNPGLQFGPSISFTHGTDTRTEYHQFTYSVSWGGRVKLITHVARSMILIAAKQ